MNETAAGKFRISDHALVRWLDRTGAMDMEQLRAMLAASLDRAFSAAAKLEASRFLVLADGMVFLVQEGTVVTVMDDDGRHARMLSTRQPEQPATGPEQA